MAALEGKCWEWPAGRDWRGYGRTRYPNSGRAWLAHRMVWEMVNGPIPEGMEVMHLCDNKPCVNPAHLQIGTHAENMRQASERHRMRDWRTHPRAKLTDAEVAEIRLRHLEGETQAELAKAFGIHGSYVSRLVRSRRREQAVTTNPDRDTTDQEGRLE
jgi:hypothetical protein